MAEGDDSSQEKTEEPTPKRLKEAKEKGQVPRSKELNMTAIMLASAAAMLLTGDYIADHLLKAFKNSFTATREQIFDPNHLINALMENMWNGFLGIMPFLVIVLLASIISPALLGGWSFSAKALAPKLEKLDPLKGIKRIFGPQGLMELVKSILKIILVGSIGLLCLWLFYEDLLNLARMDLYEGIGVAGRAFFYTFFILAASLIIIVGIDVPFQLWQHKSKLKMTKQEVKDEFKETEGKPEVKGKIRQLQRDIAQGRMMEEVPKADVVVTNPTHYAVAIKYDQLGMEAPKVIAKGKDLVAANIREIAEEHKIAIYSAPPLARALYHTTEIDQEIPHGLYVAVAQLLAYVYQLRTFRPHAGMAPPQPPNTEIPEEFEKYTKL